jgi:hypothetical protein
VSHQHDFLLMHAGCSQSSSSSKASCLLLVTAAASWCVHICVSHHCHGRLPLVSLSSIIVCGRQYDLLLLYSSWCDTSQQLGIAACCCCCCFTLAACLS